MESTFFKLLIACMQNHNSGSLFLMESFNLYVTSHHSLATKCVCARYKTKKLNITLITISCMINNPDTSQPIRWSVGRSVYWGLKGGRKSAKKYHKFLIVHACILQLLCHQKIKKKLKNSMVSKIMEFSCQIIQTKNSTSGFRIKNNKEEYLEKFRTPRCACSKSVSIIFKEKISYSLIDRI